MGWLALVLLGGGTMALLVLSGLPRGLWSAVGAAAMLGAIGYSLQGTPGLPAHVATPTTGVQPEDPAIVDLRDRMLGRFTGDGAYLVAADAMGRIGEPALAVRAVLGGIRRYPRSVTLWTGLGMALVAHDGGRVSPPALFAFRQAMRLAPDHPAPPFFLGLAHVRAGEFAAARPLWARALALCPPGLSYRQDIAARLALLDRYRAQNADGP